MFNKIKIGIVDDQLLFRKGLISLFDDLQKFDIILEAENGLDFFERLKLLTSEIDVLILDIEMPKMDGLEVLSILKSSFPKIKTLVLTMHNEDELIYELIKLGAKGFLPKNADVDEVVSAIVVINTGELYFNENVSKILIRRVIQKEGKKGVTFNVSLTEREKEIIVLICNEKATKQIADILLISERTVNSHKSNIFKKTKSINSAGVVIYALRNGIID